MTRTEIVYEPTKVVTETRTVDEDGHPVVETMTTTITESPSIHLSHPATPSNDVLVSSVVTKTVTTD